MFNPLDTMSPEEIHTRNMSPEHAAAYVANARALRAVNEADERWFNNVSRGILLQEDVDAKNAASAAQHKTQAALDRFAPAGWKDRRWRGGRRRG